MRKILSLCLVFCMLLCAAAGDDAALALGEHAMTASDIRRCAGEILRKLKV